MIDKISLGISRKRFFTPRHQTLRWRGIRKRDCSIVDLNFGPEEGFEALTITSMFQLCLFEPNPLLRVSFIKKISTAGLLFFWKRVVPSLGFCCSYELGELAGIAAQFEGAITALLGCRKFQANEFVQTICRQKAPILGCFRTALYFGVKKPRG